MTVIADLQNVCLCLSLYEVTSLPMTLIHTCSPTSTISEAFSTLEADISLTCTKPARINEYKKQTYEKLNVYSNEK